MDEERPGRRTILAAAWAAPVILATAAAPTVAASGTPSDAITVTFISTWLADIRRFDIAPQFTNNTADALVVQLDGGSFESSTSDHGWSVSSSRTFLHSLEAGETTPPNDLHLYYRAPDSLQPGEPFTVNWTVTTTSGYTTVYPAVVSY